MNFYLENESDIEFNFDIQDVFEKVALDVLDNEGCPYEVEVSLLICDEDTIQSINRENRSIDSVTDVLSFPNVDFVSEGNFECVEANEGDYFNPETGELVLGDIIICAKKAFSQAEEYGHSVKREFAFLVAHSMYHLCGYDHMVTDEAKVMEEKQEESLKRLGITRENA